MKSLLFFSIGLFILCLAVHFQQAHKVYLNKTVGTYNQLKRELKDIENDLVFLTHHRKLTDFLIKRGWFTPQSRLTSVETINQWTDSLNTVRITIEPETIKEMNNEYCFKVSKIILQIDALLDTDIYNFVSKTLKEFPGILILRKFSISRNEKVNEINLFALRQHKHPNFIVGEVICEWIAMEAKIYEE